MIALAGLIRAAGRTFLIGNGGSAANAIHIANDLISVRVRAHALTADVATLTAIANDYGYNHVFARQLSVLGARGDLLIALSGSGNSPNITKAIRKAKEKGIVTFAIVGAFNPNCAATRCAHHTHIEGEDMQAAEEAQLRIGHELMRQFKRKQRT